MYYKPLITALSLVWGGGLVGYAMNVQEDQRALIEQTSLQASPEAVRVVPPPRVATISEPAPIVIEPAVLEIPAVVIRATRHKPTALKAPEPTVKPCSGWRELGPQHVSSGKASGLHEVRELCQ